MPPQSGCAARSARGRAARLWAPRTRYARPCPPRPVVAPSGGRRRSALVREAQVVWPSGGNCGRGRPFARASPAWPVFACRHFALCPAPVKRFAQSDLGVRCLLMGRIPAGRPGAGPGQWPAGAIGQGWEPRPASIGRHARRRERPHESLGRTHGSATAVRRRAVDGDRTLASRVPPLDHM